MESFGSWHRRTERKANRSMAAGVFLLLMAVVMAAYFKTVVQDVQDPARAILVQLRWGILVPAVIGMWDVTVGAWAAFRLYRNPEGLYRQTR